MREEEGGKRIGEVRETSGLWKHTRKNFVNGGLHLCQNVLARRRIIQAYIYVTDDMCMIYGLGTYCKKYFDVAIVKREGGTRG